MNRKAVFLDRDGTLNVDKGYVHNKQELEFIDRVPEALARLKKAGFLLIVITNQSGVARGYFSEHDVDVFHNYMNKKLQEKDAAIDAFYFCPHHPEGNIPKYAKECWCRKPSAGLLEKAIADFDIDTEQSYLIGDSLRDIKAGNNLACFTILLDNNLINIDAQKFFKKECKKTGIFAGSLYEASRFILQREGEMTSE